MGAAGIAARTLAGVGLVAMLAQLAMTGLADFQRLEATRLIDAAQAGTKAPSPQALNEALENLAASSQLDPGNPLMPEYRGHVYFMRASLAAGLPRVRDGQLEYARDYYRESLALRPNSAYLWSTLALVDSMLMESLPVEQQGPLLAEIGQAIEHSMRLGPWEGYVNRTLARIGTEHFTVLSEKQQALVRQAQTRAN